MTRVIASLGSGGHEPLLALAARSIAPYAERHGYELALHTSAPDTGRPIPWAKIPILRDLVTRHELVVWLDSDLVIVDPRLDIAGELEDGQFMYMVEHRYAGLRVPNTGVLMLRGGEAAASFLDAVWELDRYTDHRWWENAAFLELLGYSLERPAPARETEWLAQTKFISPRWNWAPTARVRGARIRHFTGLTHRPRLRTALMRAALLEARLRPRRQARAAPATPSASAPDGSPPEERAGRSR